MSFLTGNLRFRRGWGGKLILQVETVSPVKDPSFGLDQFRWRDAIAIDVPDARKIRAQKKMGPFL